MAENDKDLTYSDMLCDLEAIFPHANTRRYKLKIHSHASWQIEVLTSGKILFFSETSSEEISKGDIVIIPPGVGHSFQYPTMSAWYTLRFTLDRNPENLRSSRIIRGIPFMNHQTEAIIDLLPPSGLPDSRCKRLIERILVTMMSFLDTENEAFPQKGEPQIVNRIKTMVFAAKGHSLTIREIAGELNYSEGHLSRVFKKMTGETINGFIHRIQIERAKEMLIFADMKISQIAGEMGFPDIFTFSRFFKRNTGVSPSDYRRINAR